MFIQEMSSIIFQLHLKYQIKIHTILMTILNTLNTFSKKLHSVEISEI